MHTMKHLFLLYSLALLLSTPSFCGASEYYVRSTEPINISCPGQPCFTFTEYINDAVYFFKSNTVFKFLPGTHVVNASVMVENVHNISLLAEERENRPQVINYCPSKCSSNSGDCTYTSFCLINITNATNVTLHGLIIVVNPQTDEETETLVWFVEYGLLFANISSLHFNYNQVLAAESTWACDINVLDSQYVQISSLEVSYGRIYLLRTSSVNITTVTSSYCSYCIRMSFAKNILINNSMIISADVGIIMYDSNDITISNSTVGVYCLEIFNITRLFVDYVIIVQFSGSIKLENTEMISSGIYVSWVNNVDISNVKLTGSSFGYTFYRCAEVTLNNVSAENTVTCGVYMQEVSNATITSVSLTPRKGKGIKMGIVLTNTENIMITASVFQFFSAPLTTTTDTVQLPAVVQLHDSRYINIGNCTFQTNNITALKLVRAHIKVIGALDFTGNRAYKGAAMVFIDGSSMHLSESGYVTYTNNTAEDSGGAIFIVNTYFYSLQTLPTSDFAIEGEETWINEYEFEITASQKCFVKFNSEYKDIQLIFTNNTAGRGGEILYEGLLGSASVHRKRNCLENFRNSSITIPYSLSAISSDPHRVCFCNEEGVPDFLIVFHPNVHSIYSGQTIFISVVVMGNNLGTVAGSVFANFQQPLQLKAGQYFQAVQQPHCKKLNYTIFFSQLQGEEKQVMLTLTAVKRDVSEIQYTQETIEDLIKEYKSGVTQNMQHILDLPIYVNITLLPCPPGFELFQNPSRCGCKKQLQLLPDVTCNIQYLTIQRRGLVWVGPFTDSNNTIIDVMNAQNCPLNYCKDEVVSITLNLSDTQCNYNHSGTLCGGCQPGLSLALGSPQCLKCSNEYLALLIPFALAGFVLVFFIKVLNITIPQGFINGLIFYANILQPYQHIFLRRMTSINPLTLFIAWLNLDLGIETCFVDGLTAYWKTWLQFVFPFYIWAIAGLIIISARYSSRLARVMGNNSVPVLATLFLLSYAKLLRTIITILSYTVVETPHGQKTVWSADGNIDYLGPQHAPLFVAAIATLLFLWLPYTLLLLLGQWLRKINHRHFTCALMKVKPFLDAHYGPLKDKHHYWFGVLLCMRVIILLISAVVPANNFTMFTLSMSITAGALISATSIGPAVYRNTATSIFEISLFINLGLLGLTKFYTNAAGGDQAAATYTLIGVAFIQFLGLASYQMYSILKPLFFHCCAHDDDDDDEATEGIWRYNTSLKIWNIPRRTTPYRDAATAL